MRSVVVRLLRCAGVSLATCVVSYGALWMLVAEGVAAFVAVGAVEAVLAWPTFWLYRKLVWTGITADEMRREMLLFWMLRMLVFLASIIAVHYAVLAAARYGETIQASVAVAADASIGLLLWLAQFALLDQRWHRHRRPTPQL